MNTNAELQSFRSPNAWLGFILGGIIYFSWRSVDLYTFNGLATPIFLTLCAFLVISCILFPKIKVPNVTIFYYLLFVLWVLFVDLQSNNLSAAIARDMHWFILPWFVILSRNATSNTYGRLWITLGAAASLIVIALTIFANASGMVSWVRIPIFGNIRHFSLSVASLTLFLYGVEWDSKLARFFFVAVRTLGLAMVLWSGGRTAYIGLLASLALIYFSLNESPARVRFFPEIFFAILLSLIFDVGDTSLGIIGALFRGFLIDNPSIDSISSARLTLWSKTFEALKCRGALLIGMGGNGFLGLGIGIDRQMFQPHNIFVQIIADWGLIGLMLVLVLIYKARQFITAPIDIPVAYQKANQAVVIFIVVSSFLDATLYHLEHLVYLGIALAGSLRFSTHTNVRQAKIWPYLLVLIFIAFGTLHWNLFDHRIKWILRPWTESAC